MTDKICYTNNMKTKQKQTKEQAFAMLALSDHGMTQVEIAARYGCAQSWVSQQLTWARTWQRIATESKAFRDAYENTVEMSTNGFPGHLDNVGENE